MESTENTSAAPGSAMDKVNASATGGGGSLVAAPAPPVAGGGRRPMNAFLLFCKRHRGIVKEKYPNLENRNITKILGEWWQSLSEEEKAGFNKLATEYKEHVMREQPNFRWRKPPIALQQQQPQLHHLHNHQGQQPVTTQPLPLPPPSAHVRSTGSRKRPAADEPLKLNGVSNPNSNSSSPEPSPMSDTGAGGGGGGAGVAGNCDNSSAPKPFKKRYLASAAESAARQAENGSNSSSSSSTTSETENVKVVSPEAEHACKALLQLAGVRESSPTDSPVATAATSSPSPPPLSAPAPTANGHQASRGGHGGRGQGRGGHDSQNDGGGGGGGGGGSGSGGNSRNSRSGTSSPSNGESSGGKRSVTTEEGFYSLRDAVWSKVARTLLKQEEEKCSGGPGAKDGDQADAPLNLSNQCTIRGQTIIEHIIENILDDEPADASMVGGDPLRGRRAAAVNGNAAEGSQRKNGEEATAGGSKLDAEEVKERIYQSLKEDVSKRDPSVKDTRSSLWELLPHYNITSVSIFPPGHKPQDNGQQQQQKHQKQPTPTGSKCSSPPAGVTSPASTMRRPPPGQSEQRLTNGTGSDQHVDGDDDDSSAGGDRNADHDDPSKLNIKNLLAQSPAPPSPRSKNSTTPTSSLTNALIASVLERQQQPVELLFTNHRQRLMQHQQQQQQQQKKEQLQQQTKPAVSVTLVSGEQAAANGKTLSGPIALGGASSVSLTPVQDSGKRKNEDDEDDEDVRRSARVCKGRRYQELKEEGKLGRKGERRGHKSGGNDSASDSEGAVAPLSDPTQAPAPTRHVPVAVAPTQPPLPSRPAPAAPPASTFDVAAKLNAIPALSLEDYQQKILKAKAAATAPQSQSATAPPTSSPSRAASSVDVPS
jgi:hypothetical protein